MICTIFSLCEKILSFENENKSKFILHFAHLFVPLQANMAIWWLMPPDVRESGESPGLYLQL